MPACAAEYDGFLQCLGALHALLQVAVTRVVLGHVGIHGTGLVVLALAFVIETEIVQLPFNRFARQTVLQRFERTVELALRGGGPLVGQGGDLVLAGLQLSRVGARAGVEGLVVLGGLLGEQGDLVFEPDESFESVAWFPADLRETSRDQR